MGNRRIDVAHFTCPTCGHRSTAPDTVNSIPHQMEVYDCVNPSDLPDTAAEQARIVELQKTHKGNTFRVEPTVDFAGKPRKMIKIDRCYSKVSFQSHTALEESNHITLACPQCNTMLYDVRWSK